MTNYIDKFREAIGEVRKIRDGSSANIEELSETIYSLYSKGQLTKRELDSIQASLDVIFDNEANRRKELDTLYIIEQSYRLIEERLDKHIGKLSDLGVLSNVFTRPDFLSLLIKDATNKQLRDAKNQLSDEDNERMRNIWHG